MILTEKYIKDPINTLPIPLWKHNVTAIRQDMMYVLDANYNETLYRDFQDTLYLRLQHNLLDLKLGKLPAHYFLSSYKESDGALIYNLIKECYGSNVEYDRVDHLVKDETFNDLLCVFLYNDKVFNLENMINLRKNNLGKERNYKPIGMVIAQFDQKTKEASIEYLCVSEKFRNKGLGSILLQEILLRISNIADFATVSFEKNNNEHLEKMFRKYGFEGNAIWHMLRKQ